MFGFFQSHGAEVAIALGVGGLSAYVTQVMLAGMRQLLLKLYL